MEFFNDYNIIFLLCKQVGQLFYIFFPKMVCTHVITVLVTGILSVDGAGVGCVGVGSGTAGRFVATGSRSRHNFNPSAEAALNDHINLEYSAGYQCVAIYAIVPFLLARPR